MGFLHNRVLLICALLFLLIIAIASGWHRDASDTKNAASSGETTAGLYEESTLSTEGVARLLQFIDQGALQDDGAPAPEASPEDIALLLGKDKDPMERKAENTPGIVSGEIFYQGASSSLDWAKTEELKSIYRIYMPDPLPADLFDFDLDETFGLLREAEALYSTSEATSGAAAPYYSHSLLHLELLALMRPGDATVTAARVRAWNGMGSSLPEELSYPAFAIAASLAAQQPETSLSLTQWGISLMGSAKMYTGFLRQVLFSQARQKLRTALSLNTNQAATAYALAQEAAERKDAATVELMLRKAATGEAPVSSLHVRTDTAFAFVRAEPWFAEVTGLFPGTEVQGEMTPQDVEAWVTRERTAAEPDAAESPSNKFFSWGSRLGSTTGWEGDKQKSALMIRDIDSLLSKGKELAEPPYTAANYQVWGELIAQYPFDCSDETAIHWIKKSQSLFLTALEMDPSSTTSSEALLWTYSLLLSCPNAKNAQHLYADRNAAMYRYAPPDAESMLQIYEFWAYDLVEWGISGQPSLKDSRFSEAIHILSQVLSRAEQENNPGVISETRRKLAGLKAYIAGHVNDPALKKVLLQGAQVDEQAWIATLSPETLDANQARKAGETFLFMARAFDGLPDEQKAYAKKALLWYAPPEEGLGDSPYALNGASEALDLLGVAEKDPEIKRELFYLAGTVALRALEARACDHWRWNFWGVTLNKYSQQAPKEKQAAAFALCKSLFVKLDAMNPGSESYNVACLEALTGNPEACRAWLERAKKLGTLPSRLHMQNDSDMDPVRHLPWFEAILPEE